MDNRNLTTEQDGTLPQDPEGFIAPDPATEEGETQEAVAKEKKKPVAVGYRVLSAVLLLLSVGGLFLGIVAKWLPAFEPFVAYRVIGSENAFSYTLFALILEIFKNLSALPKSVGSIIPVAIVMLTVVSVLVSVISALVAFCSGKRAKVCTHVNATALFLGYGTLFAYNFAMSSPAQIFFKGMFDLPSAILAGVALIVLIALVFINKHEASGTGKDKTLNFLLLALAYVCL
ncbi:MAG: hypothetical protein K2N74_03035, partial [Clostridiales bacterium]|nr:hypothetical protein [Clostridiales bacterium]